MAKENHLYYIPDAEGMDKIGRLREKVIELDDLIDELVGNTNGLWDSITPKEIARPWAIAKTKLEECRQRAIEAIVRKHEVKQ